MYSERITGNLVDIPARRIYPAEVLIRHGRINRIRELSDPVEGYLLPGFIDAHVHVESSMLIPSEFARLAVIHGTVATISDPHEIANVLGMQGVEYMIDNAQQVPFHFFFGAPSCVPATVFETAGARIDADQVALLLERPEVLYLSEMMNFPGVLGGDQEVLEKIAHAQRLGKPVDGHAPGLVGDAAVRYIHAGMSTDHECFTAEEALHKLQQGMWIQIREGSAAKNFDALIGLVPEYHDRMMFCSDDKHPDSLEEGHINDLCAKAIKAGVDLFDVLQVACLNPIDHYRLPIGRLRVGDAADMIQVDDLEHFRVRRTWIGGRLVAQNGSTLIDRVEAGTPNHFACTPKTIEQFQVPACEEVWAMLALDGQLITPKERLRAKVVDGLTVPDVERDLLKIVVVNRYAEAPVAVGWIRNIGLKRGAIASCVAHDSHNIVAVGTNDADLCSAVNLIIAQRGGICAVDGTHHQTLALPVAGIMSNDDGYVIARSYSELDRAAKEMGSGLSAPFMTLSFMALLVIPHLKMSDLGLFDGDAFRFVDRNG